MGEVLVLLAQRQIDPSPKLQKTRLQVEENIGEDIHIHFRNMRFELTVEEFREFASAMTEAASRLVETR